MAKASKIDSKTSILPTLLGYQRSTNATTFGMYAVVYGATKDDGTCEEKLFPITIEQTTARGTIGNHSNKEKPSQRIGTGKKAIDAANIQTIEIANLPLESETLSVKGGIRFSNKSYSPSMQDSKEYVDQMNEFLDVYAIANGYYELALRYMLNLASGRFLWRNLMGDNLVVKLNIKGRKTVLKITEDDIDMSNGFSIEAISSEKRESFKEMVDLVANSLGKKNARSVLVNVDATIELGFGAEVFPSQEFESADEKSKEKAPSKTLASTLLLDRKTRQAVIHGRKIANALRTIDTWHGNEVIGAIAVEPYGANTHMKAAYRINGNDLYSYIDNPALLKAQAEIAIQDHHHFVVACLVRGGAYQMGEGKE